MVGVAAGEKERSKGEPAPGDMAGDIGVNAPPICNNQNSNDEKMFSNFKEPVLTKLI